MGRKKKLAALDIPRETLDRIILLLVSLQSVAAVRTACVEKLQLTPQQADLAIEHAKKAILDTAETDRDQARGEAILRLNDLYERSLLRAGREIGPCRAKGTEPLAPLARRRAESGRTDRHRAKRLAAKH